MIVHGNYLFVERAGGRTGDCSFGLSGWRGNDPNLPKIHGRVLLENVCQRQILRTTISCSEFRPMVCNM